MKYFGKILKNAAVFFLVGALLALAAPYVATLVGLDPVTVGVLLTKGGAFAAHAAPLWIGAYFGAFGGIEAAVEPIVDGILKLFGHHKKPEISKETDKAGPTVTVSRAAHPDLAPEQEPELSTKFQDKVGPRAADLTFLERAATTRPQGDNFQEKLDAAQAGPQQLSV